MAEELPTLRYADGPSTEMSVIVHAPPDAVWAVVTDIAAPARYSEELQEATWLDGATGPVVGARFVGRSRHAATGEWETTSTVVACEPNVRFGWVVGDVAEPSAQWAFTLRPTDDGAGDTVLAEWMRMGPGRSGINPAIDAMPDKESKILHRRLQEHRVNMLKTIEGIKATAEGH